MRGEQSSHPRSQAAVTRDGAHEEPDRRFHSMNTQVGAEWNAWRSVGLDTRRRPNRRRRVCGHDGVCLAKA